MSRRKSATPKEQMLDDLRQAVADYMGSEGCGCCGNYDAHQTHHERLGQLLLVPKRKGYRDFAKYRSDAAKRLRGTR